MNRQEKKRYLHGYRYAKIELRKLKEEYETVYTEAVKIVPTLTGMPSSNVKDDKTSKYVARLIELERKIKECESKVSSIDEEMLNLRPYHKYMITQIDIKRVPIKVYAKKMNVNEQSVKRMRNRIIDKMFLQG